MAQSSPQYVLTPRNFEVVGGSSNQQPVVVTGANPAFDTGATTLQQAQNFAAMERANYVPVLARRQYMDHMAAASSGGFGGMGGCGGCIGGAGCAPAGCCNGASKGGGDFFDVGDLLTLGALSLLGLILLLALVGGATGRRRKRGMCFEIFSHCALPLYEVLIRGNRYYEVQPIE